MATKSLWYLVVFAILALTVIFVATVYIPFLNSNSFGFIISITFLLIVTIAISILMRKGLFPKPSPEIQKTTRILLAVFVAVVFIVGYLMGFFRVAYYQNRVFISIILTVAFFIILLLVSFKARRKYQLENRAS